LPFRNAFVTDDLPTISALFGVDSKEGACATSWASSHSNASEFEVG